MLFKYNNFKKYLEKKFKYVTKLLEKTYLYYLLKIWLIYTKNLRKSSLMSLFFNNGFTKPFLTRDQL